MKNLIFSDKNSEKGSAVVITMLILAAITIIGISAINTSNVEVLLSNNDLIYKRNLYRSEAGTMEGAQTLEDTPVPNLTPDVAEVSGKLQVTYPPDWLNHTDMNMMNTGLWTDQTAVPGTAEDTLVSVVSNKVARGSSLDMSASSRLHEFSVYGFCNPGNGSTFIEIGYKRRY